MRPIIFSLTYPSASPNAIATAQTAAGAGFLTLTASTYRLSAPAYITITSVGNDSGDTFTVTGADPSGNPQTENITGGNATIVTTTKAFSSVSSVYVNGATAGNVTVGIAQAGYSKPIPIDTYRNPVNIGVGVTISGSVTCTVQHTFADVLGTTTEPTWYNHLEMTNLTVSTGNSYDIPITAIRLNVASGGGTATLKIIQAGMPGS